VTVTSLTAQDVPFSLGAILVLVAFTIRPAPEGPPSTASLPGSDAATGRSTGRNIETASTGSKYPISDYGREGYEEYKRRWSGAGNGSKSAPAPKRSSLRQPGATEKRVSMQAPGEPPLPPMPAGQSVRTAPLGASQDRGTSEKQTRPMTAGPSTVARVPIHSRSPDAAQRVRSKRFRDTPIVFPAGSESIMEAINAQADPSAQAPPSGPRPLLLPGMRDRAARTSSSSRRSSTRGSPKRQSKPKLYVYIPPGSASTTAVQRPSIIRLTTDPSSVVAVDDNHAHTPETELVAEPEPAPEGVIFQGDNAQVQDVEVRSISSDKQSKSSSASSKHRHRRSSTALAIVTRTSSGQTQKRISIGNAGDVHIEIRQRSQLQRTPRTTSLRQQQFAPEVAAQTSEASVSVTSPRPRGPRQLPGSQRLAARDMGGPRTAPMLLGQMSFEGKPAGNWI